jgi:hypothetical protein
MTVTLGRSVAGLPDFHRVSEAYRCRYARGKNNALLLYALFDWLSSYQGPPAWIADAVCAALLKWIACEAPTLDAAFGVSRPRGQHAEKQRKRIALRFHILAQIERQRRRHVPIGRELFDLVGADVGETGSFVSTVWYDEASVAMRKILQKIRFS